MRHVPNLNPNPKPNLNLGETYSRQKRPPTLVIETYNRAVRLDPTSAPAYNNLAIMHGQAQPPATKEAIAAYKAALRLNPGQYQAHFNVGQLYKDWK